MTVRELIDNLSKEDQDALVYTMDKTDEIALLVTEIKNDILEGKEKTIVIR